MKKIVSIILIVSILSSSTNINNVIASELNGSQTVYSDGIEYLVETSDDGLSYYVEVAENNDYNGTIEFYANGAADVTINEGNITNNYNLDIKELSNENIDMNVYESDENVIFDKKHSNEIKIKNKNFIKNNKKVKSFKNKSEFGIDRYEGQALTATVVAFSLLELIDIILVITAVIVVASVSMQALSAVVADIKTDKKKKYYIYPARLNGKDIYINYAKNISVETAGSLIATGGKTGSVYTFGSDLARQCVLASGLGCLTNSEIDQDRDAGYIYYWHWHPLNRIGHAWFGRAYHK